MKTLHANVTFTGPGTGIPENEATMDEIILTGYSSLKFYVHSQKKLKII